MLVTSRRQKITTTETHFRAAVSSETNGLSFAQVINWIIDNISTPPVGSMEEAMLTEVQFQAIRGAGWVLADGRNVAGSDYQTLTGNANIPDFRGVHARGKNNGRADGKENPAGDLALGTFQSDEYKEHNHSATQTSPFPIVPAHTNGGDDQDIGNTRHRAYSPVIGLDVIPDLADAGLSTQQTVRCVTLNFFIRIN